MTDLTEEERDLLIFMLTDLCKSYQPLDRLYFLTEDNYEFSWHASPANNVGGSILISAILIQHYLNKHPEPEARLDINDTLGDILDDANKLNRILREIAICEDDLVRVRVTSDTRFEPGIEVLESLAIKYLPYTNLLFQDDSSEPQQSSLSHMIAMLQYNILIKVTYRSLISDRPEINAMRRPVLQTGREKLERWRTLLLNSIARLDLACYLDDLLDKLVCELDE